MNANSVSKTDDDNITFGPQSAYVGDTNVKVSIFRGQGDIRDPKVRFLTGAKPSDNQYIKEISKDVGAFQIDVYINILPLDAAVSSNKVRVDNGDGKTFSSDDYFKVEKRPN